jgi:anti-anti-sigma factor
MSFPTKLWIPSPPLRTLNILFPETMRAAFYGAAGSPLDSTTIDLCLSLFPWGKFRRRKSAVKLHTLLDLRGGIPANVYGTGGQVHDANILDQLLPEAERFTCLIAVMWTSLACMFWPKLAPSSSLAPKRICSSTVATHVPSNDRQDCAATKPFCWPECELRSAKQSRKNILLNLTGLHYLDSSGIGELARIYVNVVKQGGAMKVIGLTPKVEEVLKITHLSQIFQEFPDEQSALRSFPAVS